MDRRQLLWGFFGEESGFFCNSRKLEHMKNEKVLKRNAFSFLKGIFNNIGEGGGWR